jgi:transposase
VQAKCFSDWTSPEKVDTGKRDTVHYIRRSQMERQKPRRYTEEFKREALELLERSGKSMSQVERELGIGSGQLWRWRRQYKLVKNGNQEKRLEPSDLEAARAEIRRLQRQLAETQEERDILHLPWRAVPGKKAINIFSRAGR